MTDEGRILSRVALPEEAQVERQLRPRRLGEYVGQQEAVESLRVSVEAARQRSEPMDHVLLYGPPGLGKTTLAHILAVEMGTEIVATSGPARIMYASDYCHWDSEYPESVRKLAGIKGLRAGDKARVLGQNAIEWFGLRPEELPEKSVYFGREERAAVPA